MVLTPCSPRDSKESSPTSQFESINFFDIFMKQKAKQTKAKTKDILIKDETRENYFEHKIYISEKK